MVNCLEGGSRPCWPVAISPQTSTKRPRGWLTHRGRLVQVTHCGGPCTPSSGSAALLDKGYTVVDMSEPAQWDAQFGQYPLIFGGVS